MRGAIDIRGRGVLIGAGLLLLSALAGLLLSAALGSAGPHGGTGHAATRTPASATVPAFDPAAARAKGGQPPGTSIGAHISGVSVPVYRIPAARGRVRIVHALSAGGHSLPLVMLVRHRRRGWLQIQLPVRPNLATGWIRDRDVALQLDPYQVRVNLTAHTVEVLRGTRVIMRAKAGVGRSLSPTPDGRYFIVDLLRPPNRNGLYGPYAFGLSAYSTVYTSFAGGDGQVGLHGTNEPAGLGTNVSHGCIRIANRDIEALAHLLPLGTPVTIQRR